MTELRCGKCRWRRNEPPLRAWRPGSLDTCTDGAPLTENKNPEENIPSSAVWPRAIPIGSSRCIPTQVGEGGYWEGNFDKDNHQSWIRTTIKLHSSFTEKGYFKVHWYITRWSTSSSPRSYFFPSPLGQLKEFFKIGRQKWDAFREGCLLYRYLE